MSNIQISKPHQDAITFRHISQEYIMEAHYQMRTHPISPNLVLSIDWQILFIFLSYICFPIRPINDSG